MNSTFPTSALAPIAIAAIALAAQSPGARAQTVVRIAHVAPTSGAQAHFGKDNENGARLAIEELNARGVVIGGEKVRFELVAEDDAADPRQATQVAQKLCDLRVAGVVGHMNSGTALPASRVYGDCGIPNITGSATNPKLTQAGQKTTFRVIANDNALGAGVAEHAAASGIKTVAVVDDRTAYGQGIAEVFKRVARARGMQIVSEQFTTDKSVDFTAILTAIKASRPQALFFGGVDAQLGPMLRQMEQLGIRDVTVYGGDGICSNKLPELAAGSALVDRVRCAEGGVSLERMPQGKAWKQRYDQRFAGQFQVFSPYTYDATMILAHAMVRAGSTDPKVYLNKLADARLDGVTARIEFGPDGDLKHPAMTLFQYRGGKKAALSLP